ncbi:CAAX amino terminal protease self- immunity [Corynebacterium kalinowskii]|uniref:CAAX amino terminal protease self- immunity n=1 Tax=Corynebacterium kalinowskii TaxID=2675216 RepID=A0A6B8VDG2_9CORY|nr:CPBP family intramembrane glutamic endopeptidase [Corynebacterium kalinowskii]QGU01099.1 CAAX amino terminal protease self- immunity [Corynebacterium kalinowskii]
MAPRIRREIGIVLLITFGMSGIRSILRLVDSLLAGPLNEQSVTLNKPMAQSLWLDYSLQLCSALVLVGWGLLALFLLAGDGIRLPKLQWRDWLSGAGLAAVIGLPGLAFYFGAVHFGLTKEVIPSAFESWWGVPVLLVWSFANAFGEEVVVVGWLMTRLKQLKLPLWVILACTAVLRGSYHLYQGVSAGFGNIVMGLVYGWFFHRYGRIWPLILGHFLIDAVAFVGYQLL